MRGYRAEQIVRWIEIKFRGRKTKYNRGANKQLLVNFWKRFLKRLRKEKEVLEIK